MIRHLFNRIASYLIERAKRTPYFHLHHADGSLYMERYWLVPFLRSDVGCWIAKWWREPSVWLLQKLGIAVRVHYIRTPDYDKHLHDHPWPWASVVLQGGYLELRPVVMEPCFAADNNEREAWEPGPDEELTDCRWRVAGEAAFRHATDRHRIAEVMPDTITLFITWKKVQWWGFYTPAGKVYYKDYESVHNRVPLHESEIPTIPPFLKKG